MNDMVKAKTEAQSMEADIQRLDALAHSKSSEYQSARPFPHIVIDDFVRPDVLRGVLTEITENASLPWNQMSDQFQKKLASNSTRNLGPRTRSLIQFMNGQEVLGFLEKLTGISGLIADWQLAGGGVHALREGGFLGVHADFNYQSYLRLDRRINLLLYLNDDWKEEYGGNLELWNNEMSACVERVVPLFNRCVIFNTTDTSYHGNPVPVAAPGGRTRLSLAFYYYSNGRPAGEVSDEHMTIFKYRPGEASARSQARRFVKSLTPPIFTDWLDRRRNG